MPRVKISEFRAKTILNNHLKSHYSGFPLDANHDVLEKIDDSVNPEKRYVVKVDQGVKKRFKQGLLELDLSGIDKIFDAITNLRKKGYSHFVIEEFIPHEHEAEKYFALERTVKGTLAYYSHKGGVDVESSESEVKKELIKDSDDTKKIANELEIDYTFLEKIVEVFDINYFSFLEINPLVVSFKAIYMLDVAVEVDSAAEFFVDNWSSKDFRESRRDLTQEEINITKLSEKSQASFKLVVLNPEGSIFMLLSGGGASIVLADEVHNLGKGKELANYGEYSGNPNEEETLLYTKNILSLLLKSKAQDKVLIIGGGVANFTDVRITFKGVVRALEEVKEDLKKQGIRIFVRRGGPHQEEGLAMMKEFMSHNNLGGEVYGPEIVLTDIVAKAIK